MHSAIPAALLLAAVAGHAELRVPAFTAYTWPDAAGAQVDERGITGWKDPARSVRWYGLFRQSGPITARVALRLPKDSASTLALSVAGQSREVTVRGAGPDLAVNADFGTFRIERPGYQCFTLASHNEAGQPAGDFEALVLDGPALTAAHFNFEERRNAASVHLMYPVPTNTAIAAFYTEVTALEDPTASFYMACGWHRGYFGMQVNSPTERRIIFSVWDSGDEAVDRRNVADANRVQLVAKGAGVYTGDFGNEGTGGHSHLKVPWKTGITQRFLVTAQPTNDTFTVFSGHWYHPEQQRWILISAWRAPKEGGWLRRPHSFSENFWGDNGHLRRKALYGNQWIQTPEGQWIELTEATFSHDPTGRQDRLDRFMGVEQGAFFLSHGGFVEGFTKFGERFTRPALGQPPRGLPLPDATRTPSATSPSPR